MVTFIGAPDELVRGYYYPIIDAKKNVEINREFLSSHPQMKSIFIAPWLDH
ncbi:MAG: hypothetical protein KAS48_06405 [Gammaproteobacteria bacterium]|nr:hypothetical protein [Gammaproteobacteria bacterium]